MTQDNNQEAGFATKCIHAGFDYDPATGATQVPIYQSCGFQFKNTQSAGDLFGLEEFGNIYARITNPTVGVLEHRLAELEGGVGATCSSSGHAAEFLAALAFMQPGDHVVASTKLYGGSISQMGRTYKQFGWDCTFVNPDTPEDFKGAITPKTKAIFVECVANPGGVVVDLEPISAIAKDAGILLIVDNTMASPYLCQPKKWGADLIIHSTTKYLCGGGSSMGGVVIDSGTFPWEKYAERYPLLNNPEPAYHGMEFRKTFGDLAFTVYTHAMSLKDIGPCQSPHNAFLTLQGLETLPLRMEKHVSNAMEVAQYLHDHKDVEWVSYAGLKDNKYHELAKKYTPKGPGAVFTFGVKGGYETARAMVENCKMVRHVANIGDTRTLMIHPASTTHRNLSDEHKKKADVLPEAVRLSVGIEDAEDIKRDIDQAIHAASNGRQAA